MPHSTKLIFNKPSNRKTFYNVGNLVNIRGLNLHNKFLDRSKFNFMNITAGTRIISISNTMTK